MGDMTPMKKRWLKVLDSDERGDSFDTLIREAPQLAENKAQAIHWLQLLVLKEFVNRRQRDAVEIKLEENNNKKTERNSRKQGLEGEKSQENERLSPRKKRSNVHVVEEERQSLWPPKKRSNSSGQTLVYIRKKAFLVPKFPCELLKRRIEEQEGTEIKLVTIKLVYPTDLSTGHDRLSIPFRQILDKSFLTEKEKADLAEKSKKKKERRRKEENGMRVKLMEPCGEISDMIFVQWNLSKTESYALRTSWNNVVDRNVRGETKYFKVHDVIQLWSFRAKGLLCFAIIKVGDASSATMTSQEDAY